MEVKLPIIWVLWAVASIVISGIWQTDTTHFTNWVWYTQAAFYFSLVVYIGKSNLYKNIGDFLHRYILPIVFLNNTGVCVGAYFVLESGSELYHEYVDDYGKTQVELASAYLHALPFAVTSIYILIHRGEISRTLKPLIVEITDYIVLLIVSGSFLPIIYQLFYNPTVVYKSNKSNTEIIGVVAAAYVIAFVAWCLFLLKK